MINIGFVGNVKLINKKQLNNKIYMVKKTEINNCFIDNLNEIPQDKTFDLQEYNIKKVNISPMSM